LKEQIHISSQDCLSAKQLVDYCNGHLEASAARKAEEHFSSCDLCSEAIDGVWNMDVATRNEYVKSFQIEKTALKVAYKNTWRIAAAVLALFSCGALAFLFFNKNNQKNEIAINTNISKEKEIITDTSTITTQTASADTPIIAKDENNSDNRNIVKFVPPVIREEDQIEPPYAKDEIAVVEKERKQLVVSSEVLAPSANSDASSSETPSPQYENKESDYKSNDEEKDLKSVAVTSKKVVDKSPKYPAPIASNNNIANNNNEVQNTNIPIEKKKQVAREKSKLTIGGGRNENTSYVIDGIATKENIPTQSIIQLYNAKKYQDAIAKANTITKSALSRTDEYYLALSYYAIGKIDEAVAMMKRLSTTNGDWQNSAKSKLKQWEGAN
jgi:hypothetical protein